MRRHSSHNLLSRFNTISARKQSTLSSAVTGTAVIYLVSSMGSKLFGSHRHKCLVLLGMSVHHIYDLLKLLVG